MSAFPYASAWTGDAFELTDDDGEVLASVATGMPVVVPYEGFVIYGADVPYLYECDSASLPPDTVTADSVRAVLQRPGAADAIAALFTNPGDEELVQPIVKAVLAQLGM